MGALPLRAISPGLRVGGTRKERSPPTPSSSSSNLCKKALPGKATVMEVRTHSWKRLSSGRRFTHKLKIACASRSTPFISRSVSIRLATATALSRSLRSATRSRSICILSMHFFSS